MKSILLYSAVLFYIFSILNGSIYFTYIWQLKEYRLDRFLDYFSTSTGRKRILPLFYISKLLCIVIGAVSYFFTENIDIVIYCSLFGFIVEFLDFLFRILKRKLYRPKNTTKATLVTGGTAILMLILGTGIQLYTIDYRMYIIILFICSLFLVIINSLVVLFFQPITKKMKAKVINQAKQKIERYKKLKIIGITGSYGKSSTKEFLYQILSAKYQVLKTPANINVDIGVAQVILKDLKDNHEIMIVEMGAYKQGEIKAICDIVHPDIGVITAVADQHLALFKSLRNIQEAKYELISSLTENGTAIVNVDTPGAADLADRAIKDEKNTITCSVDHRAKLMTLNVKVYMEYLEFEIHSIKFKANLYGRQNIFNLLNAIAVAREVGMNLREISRAVNNIKCPNKIMQLKGKGQVLVIDDSYNANPDGVMAALNYLEIFKEYKKIIIFPGMLELGPKTDAEHIRVGRNISKVCDFAIFTCLDYINAIKIGLGDFDSKKYMIESDQDIIFSFIKNKFANEKIVVLFESRGGENIMKNLLN